MDYKTYVSCRFPRVRCNDEKVRQIAVDWASKNDRPTCCFESKVIDILLAAQNQRKTANMRNSSFRPINRIIHRSTERGIKRRDIDPLVIQHISIDEKSFKKGHDYVRVLSRPRSGALLDLVHGRDTAAVEGLMKQTFTQLQLDQVCTLSMDM